MDDSPETNIKPNVPKAQPKPPPIVAESSVPMREIQRIVGDDCMYKRTSTGTKIFPQTKEKYDFCIKSLKEGMIEFHSYNSKENKLYTTFVYGLPRLKPDEIMEDLKTYNLSPKSVSEVVTKYSSADDAVYKIQFERKSFNPNYLRNVKSICKVLITWKKHKPKKSERPTQCWNCLMYGHGGDHCNRKPACMTCAKTHKTSECPFTKDNKRPAVFSCFNCKQAGEERTDHAANDIKCPLRQKYLEIRQRVTSGHSRRVQVGRPRHTNAHSQGNTTHHITNVHSQANTTHHITSPHHTNRHTYASTVINEGNDLFTIDELFNIFSSALDDLSRCTSKVQQIHVVMSLLKYAHDIK